MENNIETKNEQIALMLGGVYSESTKQWGFGNAMPVPEIKIGGVKYENLVSAQRHETELKYHCDWAWLMDAVQFINELEEDEFSVDEWVVFDKLLDLVIFTSMEKVFELVANFAYHHNKRVSCLPK
jgi:hypothetical protein